ncbi:hypothetical protein Dda_6631 [Drechslerella dactyloides]|uniref:Uncharacterized protein n=1 Tax=Drechslerella dactyloides TaxID=74499 RepID=A0AAD6IVY0_DREDA|nr:hypothetical protein Dda_6631 [Drechslerella dactyloides]
MAAAALQMLPSLSQDIHTAAFMPQHRPFPKPRQPKLAIPPSPMRPAAEPMAESKATDADAVKNTNASSPILPTTPKLRRKRKSFAEPSGTAPDIAPKRRRLGKDPKCAGQSPEKSGEEQEGPTRESYPDPRWMNEPRRYLHLRDHRYKYISKITNKLLDDAEWHDKAKEYQEIQQKKTGTWMSLNQHLYNKNKPLKDCIPPSGEIGCDQFHVNPLELIIDLVLKHGAATPEDRNQEPSISGCFLRLTGKLVNNEPLAKCIEHELVDTIASRERTVADDASTQQASPVASAAPGPLDQPTSPTSLQPGSPSGLDLTAGPSVHVPPAPSPPAPTSPSVPRTVARDRETPVSPLRRTRSGAGVHKHQPQPKPSQTFGPSSTLSNGFPGHTAAAPPAHTLYDLPPGYPGNLPAYGISSGLGPSNVSSAFVDLAASPTLPISNSPLAHSTGLPPYYSRLAPRTRSPLGYNAVSAAVTTASYIQPQWTTYNDRSPLYSPQDRGGEAPVLQQDSFASPREHVSTNAAGLPFYPPHQQQHEQPQPQQQQQPHHHQQPQQQMDGLDVLALDGVMDDKFQEFMNSLGW